MDIKLENFPTGSQSINGTHSITFSYDELIHAAFTVGRRSYNDVFHTPHYSMKEVIFRIAMIEAFLVYQNNGEVSIASNFEQLDPTEKGAVNYFIGSVFTNLISRQLFETQYLMHLDVYVRDMYRSGGINVEMVPGGRPDFVGFSPLFNWMSIESKGRVKYSSRTVIDAVDQSRKLLQVNGEDIGLKLGNLTFRNSLGELNMIVSDPEEAAEDAFKLVFPFELYIKDYYSVIMLFLENFEQREIQVEGETFIVISQMCDRLTIGIAKKIYDKLGDPLTNFESFKEGFNFKDINAQDAYFIGNDGILVHLE